MLVITPHKRMSLGPTKALQVFLDQQVVWLNLEALSCRPQLDPLLNLLTLPVRPESELAASSQQILARRPDLKTVVLPVLVQRFPQLTEAQIMVIAGIPREAAKMTLRLLNRRCGPLTGATTAQIQALPLSAEAGRVGFRPELVVLIIRLPALPRLPLAPRRRQHDATC